MARALDTLCRAYWPPLYAYVRRDGRSPHEAQDLVQEFISLLLRRNDLASVSPAKGRFRSFLLASLKHFLVSHARTENARKRGGDAEVLSLEAEQAESFCRAELTDGLTPDRAFDRHWARTVMARALERLRAEHQTPSQRRLFTALEPALTDSARVTNQAALAAELGISPGALAVAATRLRQRYRALLGNEVTQTLTNAADLTEEMRALREAWT